MWHLGTRQPQGMAFSVRGQDSAMSHRDDVHLGVIDLGDTEASCWNGVVLVLKWGAGAADNQFIK